MGAGPDVLTAGVGAWTPSRPFGTKASCRVIPFIARVQISKESGAFEVPW